MRGECHYDSNHASDGEAYLAYTEEESRHRLPELILVFPKLCSIFR
jgi:hypothetical protein